MRLTEPQRQVIKSAAGKYFGAAAEIYLFGSRVDDTQRGGDIDLYVKSPENYPDLIKRALRMNAEIQLELGEQQIDIVTNAPHQPVRAIDREARAKGIRL